MSDYLSAGQISNAILQQTDRAKLGNGENREFSVNFDLEGQALENFLSGDDEWFWDKPHVQIIPHASVISEPDANVTQAGFENLFKSTYLPYLEEKFSGDETLIQAALDDIERISFTVNEDSFTEIIVEQQDPDSTVNEAGDYIARQFEFTDTHRTTTSAPNSIRVNELGVRNDRGERAVNLNRDVDYTVIQHEAMSAEGLEDLGSEVSYFGQGTRFTVSVPVYREVDETYTTRVPRISEGIVGDIVERYGVERDSPGYIEVTRERDDRYLRHETLELAEYPALTGSLPLTEEHKALLNQLSGIYEQHSDDYRNSLERRQQISDEIIEDSNPGGVLERWTEIEAKENGGDS